MAAAVIVLLIFLVETFLTGFLIARVRSMSDELDVFRGLVQTCGVHGGAAADQVVPLDVASETKEEQGA